MQDLNDKVKGNKLTATEWNEVPSEIQNVIEASGQTLSSGDLTQLRKATNLVLANIASLRAVTSGSGTVTINGYTTGGDGGGGEFYWDSASTETDNGGTIIKATAITTGRWIRLYSGAANVRWFGAKGDGVTDDTTAIQAAIDSLPSTGGSIYSPTGVYRIVAGLTVAAANVQFIGDYGKTFNETIGTGLYGSVYWLDATNTILLDIAAGALVHQGPTIRGMAFVATSTTGTTLVRIKLMNRWLIDHSSFRNAAIGIDVDWGSNDSAWGKVDHCILKSNTIGLNLTANCLVVGGDWENTTSIKSYSGVNGQIKIMGAKFDTGIGIDLKAFDVSIIGNTFERCNPAISIDGTGVSPSGERTTIIGNSISGSGSETGITITANATQTQMLGNEFSNLGTRVSDSGVNTLRLDHDEFSWNFATGVINLNPGIYFSDNLYVKGDTNPYVAINNTAAGGKEWRIRARATGDIEFKNEDDSTLPFTIIDTGGIYMNESSSAPAAVTASTGLYIELNGSNKQELKVRWAGGTTAVIATEP